MDKFNQEREISIFIDTKNYSTARNMFQNLGQYKAYLREIDNFDQLYIIQQGGRGITKEDIIKKLESAIAKEDIDFELSGFSEGCASGKLKYNFTKQGFEGGLYLDPIILGVKAKIKSKGLLEFDLVDVDKSWSITDKTNIYESE